MILAIAVEHLHLDLLLQGLVVGALAVAVGWRVPAARGPGAAVVSFVAVVLLRVSARYPASALLVVAAALAGSSLGALLVVDRRGAAAGGGSARLLATVLTLAVAAIGAIYVTVPDTEGCVLGAGALVPLALAWWTLGREWSVSLRALAVDFAALAAFVVVIAVQGSAERNEVLATAAVRAGVWMVIVYLAIRLTMSRARPRR